MANTQVASVGFSRPPAIKMTLQGVMQAQYVQEKEQNPNYILSLGDQVFKVSLIAAIVYKEEIGTMTIFLLDDATSRLPCRIFEENQAAHDMQIGDVVHVIGKVRVYNEEKYVSPEICKKVNPLWLKVRMIELGALAQRENPINGDIVGGNTHVKKDVDMVEMHPSDKIMQLICSLDKGDGVFIEELLEQSPFDNTQSWLDKMLERGDIFQNQPGKVKML